MALELIKTPAGQPNAGIFNLPIKFDTKVHAAEWAEEGQVEQKRQRQHIMGTKYTADGWEIWRHNKSDKPTTVKSVNGKTYVLMCRPRQVQDDVNAMCGNVSKEAISREIKGQTIAGDAPTDGGMLPEERLKRELGNEEPTEEDAFRPNVLSEQPAA